MATHGVHRRGWRAVVALLASSVIVAGCSGSSANNGGDTSCADFLEMNGSEQTEVITKFMEDEGRDLSGANVNLHKLSAIAFCNTVGMPDSKIREIDGK